MKMDSNVSHEVWWFARRKLISDLYVIESRCAACPGAKNGCPFVAERGYVFTDLLPDVWYDMPCSQGTGTVRYLYLIVEKATGKKLVATSEASLVSYSLQGLSEEGKESPWFKFLKEVSDSIEGTGPLEWPDFSENSDFSLRRVSIVLLKKIPLRDTKTAYRTVSKSFEEVRSVLREYDLIGAEYLDELEKSSER